MPYATTTIALRPRALFALILLGGAARADDTAAAAPVTSFTDGLLAPAAFGKPLVAEQHSTLTKIEIGYSKSYSEFDLLEEKSRFDRPVVELHIGVDIPLYAGGGVLEGGNAWGLALTLPMSVHVLEDMWGPLTAPVINTDYRFGSPRLAYIERFANAKDSLFKNWSLTWLPMFHECTHLGDEITIYRKDANVPITRINVSYEFSELQLTLNDPDGARDTRHTARIGVAGRISDRGLGWYSVREDSELTQPVAIAHSAERFEYYADYQFQRADGPLASPRALNVFAIEARNRVRYGYPLYRWIDGAWQAQEVREQLVWSFNAYAGWRFFPKADGERGVGVYAHAYYGINPFGQLRNYTAYPFYALAVTYDL
jgi:hypothetical protein